MREGERGRREEGEREEGGGAHVHTAVRIHIANKLIEVGVPLSRSLILEVAAHGKHDVHAIDGALRVVRLVQARGHECLHASLDVVVLVMQWVREQKGNTNHDEE